MTGILLPKAFVASFGTALAAAAARAGIEADVLHLPDDPERRLNAADCERLEIAFLTRDLRYSAHYEAFATAVAAAPNLKWLHFSSTGIDQYPFLPALHERGVRLTSSAGSNGEPVGQTAICGLLMLARGMLRCLDAQRRHAWEPRRGAAVPRDLAGQAVAIIGMGNIGATVARFCGALGMHVIGLRRRVHEPHGPADEVHTLAQLPAVLPRCRWVVLACPHTAETHHVLNTRTLALLPPGACIVNVARGGLIEEPALIEALAAGRLGGAYLDVFETEPLPAHSPLWALPNVICTPHNASASSGNELRAAEIFFANLQHWAGGEPMLNERPA